jgi:hypothetical protein
MCTADSPGAIEQLLCSWNTTLSSIAAAYTCLRSSLWCPWKTWVHHTPVAPLAAAKLLQRAAGPWVLRVAGSDALCHKAFETAPLLPREPDGPQDTKGQVPHLHIRWHCTDVPRLPRTQPCGMSVLCVHWVVVSHSL